MLRRSAIKPRRQNAPRPAEKNCSQFLQWLRGRPCFLAGHALGACEGRIEAAHVDHAGGKGMGTKVADKHAIPLCSTHHREQHSKGWGTFQAKYGFHAVDVAGDYWHLWPGRVAYERKLAERTL